MGVNHFSSPNQFLFNGLMNEAIITDTEVMPTRTQQHRIALTAADVTFPCKWEPSLSKTATKLEPLICYYILEKLTYLWQID